ncbi:MAG: hypothetical protein FJ335_03975 [Sphingomonadales bacterium]|nr:hypothetical protein [Sphingomonadales bacterium]
MTRRRILIVIGLAAFAMGMLWIGQGLGYVRWPRSSFMIDQRPWITRGAALAVLGLVMVLYARRSRR